MNRTSNWQQLASGTDVKVVKHDHPGNAVADYMAVVIDHGDSGEWLVVEATWTRDEITTGALHFSTGDRLVEYFSPIRLFNAFAVFSPGGEFRGWYANVTRLPTLDLHEPHPVVGWYDLYVDVVVMPDGSITVLDEDEMESAGIPESDPALTSQIRQAQDELLQAIRHKDYPFNQ